MIVFFVKVKVSKLLIFAVNNKAANLYMLDMYVTGLKCSPLRDGASTPL